MGVALRYALLLRASRAASAACVAGWAASRATLGRPTVTVCRADPRRMTNVIYVTVAALQPTVAALRSQPVGVMEAVDQLPRMTSVEFVMAPGVILAASAGVVAQVDAITWYVGFAPRQPFSCCSPF